MWRACALVSVAAELQESQHESHGFGRHEASHHHAPTPRANEKAHRHTGLAATHRALPVSAHGVEGFDKAGPAGDATEDWLLSGPEHHIVLPPQLAHARDLLDAAGERQVPGQGHHVHLGAERAARPASTGGADKPKKKRPKKKKEPQSPWKDPQRKLVNGVPIGEPVFDLPESMWNNNSAYNEWVFRWIMTSSIFWTLVSWVNCVAVHSNVNIYRLPKRLRKKGFSVKQLVLAMHEAQRQREALRGEVDAPSHTSQQGADEVEDWAEGEASAADDGQDDLDSVATSEAAETVN